MEDYRKILYWQSINGINDFVSPICLIGMPGIGDIGKFALDQLIGILNPKKYCDIIFYDYPAGAIVEGSLLSTPKCEILVWKDPKGVRDIVLVTSDAQSMTPKGIYQISDLIAEILVKELGVSLILSLGAYPVRQSMNNFETFYVTSTTIGWAEKLVNTKDFEPVEKGVIIGSNGLIPTIAFMRFQVDGLVIMAEIDNNMAMNENYTDIKSSIQLLELVALHFDLPIEPSVNKSKIKEIENDIDLRKKEMEGEFEQPIPVNKKAADGGSLYI